MNRIILAGLLLSLVVGGVVLADSFQGVLATISYHVTGPQETISTTINLGNLKTGESGKVVTTTLLSLPSSGYYTFKLNNGALKGEFSAFVVILKFGNYTITLTKQRHESQKVFIPAGNYSVTIIIYFTVAKHVHNRTVMNVPLILVKEENS